jgi:hypothetical protein
MSLHHHMTTLLPAAVVLATLALACVLDAYRVATPSRTPPSRPTPRC